MKSELGGYYARPGDLVEVSGHPGLWRCIPEQFGTMYLHAQLFVDEEGNEKAHHSAHVRVVEAAPDCDARTELGGREFRCDRPIQHDGIHSGTETGEMPENFTPSRFRWDA